MASGLRDDGTHRWQLTRTTAADGTFSVEMWHCIDCDSWAREDRPDFQWGPRERLWQASKPRPCNAAIRAERLARVAALQGGV